MSEQKPVDAKFEWERVQGKEYEEWVQRDMAETKAWLERKRLPK